MGKPRRFDIEVDDPYCSEKIEREDGSYVEWSEVGEVYNAAMALWKKVEEIGMFVNTDTRIKNEFLKLWWACRVAEDA